MAAIIKYLKGTPKQYQAYKDANKVVSNYFYFITGPSYNEETKDWTGPEISNLYLGYIKLSNGKNLREAVLALEAKDKEFAEKLDELGVEEGNSVQDLIDKAIADVTREWEAIFNLLAADLEDLENALDSTSAGLGNLTETLSWKVFN